MSRTRLVISCMLLAAIVSVWIWGVATGRIVWVSLREFQALERRVEALEAK